MSCICCWQCHSKWLFSCGTPKASICVIYLMIVSSSRTGFYKPVWARLKSVGGRSWRGHPLYRFSIICFLNKEVIPCVSIWSPTYLTTSYGKSLISTNEGEGSPSTLWFVKTWGFPPVMSLPCLCIQKALVPIIPFRYVILWYELNSFWVSFLWWLILLFLKVCLKVSSLSSF